MSKPCRLNVLNFDRALRKESHAGATDYDFDARNCCCTIILSFLCAKRRSGLACIKTTKSFFCDENDQRLAETDVDLNIGWLTKAVDRAFRHGFCHSQDGSDIICSEPLRTSFVYLMMRIVTFVCSRVNMFCGQAVHCPLKIVFAYSQKLPFKENINCTIKSL